MQCPQCNIVLVTAERLGVEIDHCPKCRGVWLDRGELDKIIERDGGYRTDRDDAPRGRSEPVTGHRDDDDDDDDRPRSHSHGRKRSFWQELFD